MRPALELAETSGCAGEVPVGALIVSSDNVDLFAVSNQRSVPGIRRPMRRFSRCEPLVRPYHSRLRARWFGIIVFMPKRQHFVWSLSFGSICDKVPWEATTGKLQHAIVRMSRNPMQYGKTMKYLALTVVLTQPANAG
jgi:hypothetical protein